MTQPEEAYDFSEDARYEVPTSLEAAKESAATWETLWQAGVAGDDVETGDPRRPVLRGEGVLNEAEHHRLRAELELSAAQVEALNNVGELFANLGQALIKLAEQVVPLVLAAFKQLADAVAANPSLQPLIEQARRTREMDTLCFLARRGDPHGGHVFYDGFGRAYRCPGTFAAAESDAQP